MVESLLQKHRYLCDKLKDWNDKIEPVRSVPEHRRLAYRDRVSLALQNINGTWEAGMLKRDQFIPVLNCPIHTLRINRVLDLVLHSLPGFDYFPAVRYVQTGKQLTLVIKSKILPSFDWITDCFKEEFFSAGMDGLWLHLFPSSGKKVFGKGGWHLISGNGLSVDENGLYYGPAAFQQLLPELAQEALYEAECFLKPSKENIIADLYSGTGSSLKVWKRSGAKAIGVEQIPESVNLAKLNVPEIKVLIGTCGQRIPQLDEWATGTITRNRLLYLNPPRTGIEENVLNWITGSYKPDRMAYLSCNALTLRNDLHHLSSGGYEVKKVIPFDFFPGTRHIETLVFISKSA